MSTWQNLSECLAHNKFIELTNKSIYEVPRTVYPTFPDGSGAQSSPFTSPAYPILFMIQYLIVDLSGTKISPFVKWQ